MKNASTKHLFYALAAAFALPTAALAATPVVFWDGASADCNFSSLTRTVGDNTYTLNLNEMNTVGGGGSYIQIGNENAKAAVTMTVQNANPTVTNGFGTSGKLTVVMKCCNLITGESVVSSRGLMGLMDGNLYSSDNGVKLGIASRPGNAQLWFYKDGVYDNWSRIDFVPTAEEYVIALTYDSDSEGLVPFINGKKVERSFTCIDANFTTPTGIVLGGVDTDGSSKLYSQKSMKIEAVAVYTNCLSEAELKRKSITVSAINEDFGTAKDITVALDDGAVVFGDTTFTSATNVKFACNGSITILPPAGNAAAFDFSGVSGEAVVLYSGSLPAVSGGTFTSTTVPTWVNDSAKWTNTIALSGMTISTSNTSIDFNSYGNAESAIRLSGVDGWINTVNEYVVPLVLENGNYDFAFKITNGNSPQSSGDNVNRCARFRKISGTGNIVDGIGNSATPVFKVYDVDQFSGSITLNAASLVVCNADTVFDDTLYNLFVANGKQGSIYVANGKSATLADGKNWNVRHLTSYGNPTVDGTVTASASVTVQGPIAGFGRIVAPSGSLPVGSFTDAAWEGSLSISGISTPKNGDLYPFNLQNFCSVNSTVELSAVGSTTNNTTYLPAATFAGRVVLEDSGDVPALRLSDGISYWCSTFAELAGSGTFTNINANVYQGLTINVMTNFTGVFAPSKMTVTFGTAQRAGRVSKEDQSDTEYKSKLYIDPDAIISVPAGFRLWAPVAIAFNGPVNFTTDVADYDGLVLFDNIGTGLNKPARECANLISINGAPIDRRHYMVKRLNGQLVIKKKHLYSIILR